MLHKSYLFVFLIMLLAGTGNLYSQDFNWAKGFGAANADYGHAIATDAGGNIYLTGEFYTSVTFTPLPALTSYGNVDFFLTKLDSVGNGKWVRKGGGTLTDRGFGITFDNSGNLIASGVFYGASTFQGGANPDVVVTSAGNLDGFVAKYDTAGTLTWLRPFTSVSQTSVRQSVVDNANNIISVGYFGSSGIDTVKIGNITVQGNGNRDGMVVKLDPAGNALWGKAMGSDLSTEEAKAVCVDESNNIYVTGFFQDTANFGGTSLISKGLEDIFVAKYSPTGSLIWVKSFGGPKNDEGYGIALDNSGNIVFSGNFDSAAVFGTTTPPHAGAYDAFIAKLDPSGNLLWIKTGGSSEAEYGYSLAKDGNNNFYLAGSFRSTANFSGTSITSAGVEDAYVAKYNSQGDLLLIRKGGSATADRGLGVKIDLGGNIMLTGRYTGAATFGTITLPAALSDDLFLVKIGNNPIVPVELTSFTAEASDGKVLLKWSTATEVNNQGFYVERSSDNNNFQSVAFVNGKGTTTEKQNYTFTDIQSGKLYYRLRQVDFDGTTSYSKAVEIDVMPSEFSLQQNYPNPFNPRTTINYTVKEKSAVTIKLYDVLGNEVAALVNEVKEAGSHSIDFSAANLSSGVYFYKMTAGNFTSVRKMNLLK